MLWAKGPANLRILEPSPAAYWFVVVVITVVVAIPQSSMCKPGSWAWVGSNAACLLTSEFFLSQLLNHAIGGTCRAAGLYGDASADGKPAGLDGTCRNDGRTAGKPLEPTSATKAKRRGTASAPKAKAKPKGKPKRMPGAASKKRKIDATSDGTSGLSYR